MTATRPPAAVATLGRLPDLEAKMAHGILRYCAHVVAVVDAAHAGQSLRSLVPYAGRELPIVADVEQAFRLGARELVIGSSPPGGLADRSVIGLSRAAGELGMYVVSGLHDRLGELPELARFADRIVDLRHRRIEERVGHGACASLSTNVVLTVASDAASGKMTTALELQRRLDQRDPGSAAFVATGQTGMYIAGDGAAIDAVRSDFVAGVTERLVLDAASSGAGYVLVEGQGSLLHPAYSGVSLALLHGSAPNLLVFCHDLRRSKLAYFDQRIVGLPEQIELLERLAAPLREAAVVGVVALADEREPEQAEKAREALSAELGLQVLAPTPEGYDRLAALVAEF